jgi:NADH-quinone oxidoreductase subunit L
MTLATLFGCLAIGAPLVLVAVLGIPTLLGRPLTERASARACRWTVVIGLLACIGALGLMLTTGDRRVVINFGNWVAFQHNVPGEQEHYQFTLKFEFDRLSVPFAILSYALCGTVGAFATRYLHRESGYNRFFVFYALFLVGMVVASLADTIETLFIGWEFVGLSSALLVAFFQERPAPTRNGFSIWVVYRVSDAALLLAAVALHHVTGEGDFDRLLGSESWPNTHSSLTTTQALLIGLLLLLAAAGKSALVPFSGWLPRAMEGPTPSSVLRRTVGAPGCLPPPADEPAHRDLGVAGGDRRVAGTGHRNLRLPHWQRPDGHQVRAVVRLAGPGRHHCG